MNLIYKYVQNMPKIIDETQVDNSKGYNTNLASEFYVLSMLYRNQIEAYLTLGNKKSVDILVRKRDGQNISIDVKGAITGDWLLGNKPLIVKENHYIVLVHFGNKIEKIEVTPRIYVIPSNQILPFTKNGGKGYSANLKILKEKGNKYLYDWSPFKN